MDGKKVSSTDNSKRYLTIGGIGLVGLAMSYYLYRRLTKKMSKGLVLKILKETRKEQFPLLKRIQGRRDMTSKSEWLSHMKDEVKAIQQKIIAKHVVSLSDFEYSSTIQYKDDEDIKLQQDLIQADAVNAYEQKLDITTKLPAFLTPQKLFEIIVKHMKGNLRDKKIIFGEYIQKGQKIPNDPQFVHSVRQREQKILEEVMTEVGLTDLEDHYEKIYAYALINYSKDPTFETQRKLLDSAFNTILVKIVQGVEEVDPLIERLGGNLSSSINY